MAGAKKTIKQAKQEESAAFELADFLELAEASYPKNVEQFEQAVKEDRRSHLYLLAGAGEEEKLALALRFASMVLGDDEDTTKRIGLFDHPDLVTVLPEKPGAAIKIAQIRAIVPELTTTALESDVKVFIIDRVETLTTAAANSLLKFIEEPAGPQLIILLADRAEDVLQTIVSRAQVVHLTPTPEVEAKAQAGLAAFKDDVQPLVFKWFETAMVRDVSVMAYTQSTLLPKVSEKAEEDEVMLWIQQLARDVFMNKSGANATLYFPQLAGFYKQIGQRYSTDQLQKALEKTLVFDQLKKVQVSFQSKLEKVALEMAIVLK
ncbi:DNA polymerase III subunit delta [Fructobacillus sp. M2-14]|uniref:DNA polymerase III subunit delta n=1 Tax=Fructobacillus broussonetiae TaxID=2713173 RepID=A0ABS5QZP0_9LACO|nr:DNA polymerase III subunit delta [Fructobacillus broussonetiae]MBS9338646.1 DNA polymerase III subunit delta [Fructobacillus broussonetiae]